MIYFGIYLLLMIEQIAAFLAIGGTIFYTALVGIGLTYAGAFAFSYDKESLDQYILKGKRYRKLATITAFSGALMFTTSHLLPSKRDLAIIVVAGKSYEVITSPEARELGGKAVDLLKKQMDDALKDPLESNIPGLLKDKAEQEIKNAING